MSRSSLGVVLVALGTPRARRDLRLCGFSSTASLDEVCRTLAATGMYCEESLRTDALRALGLVLERRFKSAEGATRHLAKLHRRLGVWASASCAREALCTVPLQDNRQRIAVETAEGLVRGEATKEQARKAANDAAGNFDAVNAYAAAYVAAYAAANAATYAAANAATYAAANAATYAAADAATYAAWVTTAAADANAADAAEVVAWSATAAADAYAATTAPYEGYARNAARNSELRRLVGVVTERLVLFPAWAGDPAEDLWPMPTRKR